MRFEELCIIWKMYDMECMIWKNLFFFNNTIHLLYYILNDIKIYEFINNILILKFINNFIIF